MLSRVFPEDESKELYKFAISIAITNQTRVDEDMRYIKYVYWGRNKLEKKYRRCEVNETKDRKEEKEGAGDEKFDTGWSKRR